ncbi:MAG: 3-dehydroquinate synthase [Succinivibrio sp.]|jgi:3-dehydroquinate synthase|nr:3-dehydroquinate synthase [Succinivibrio sp.]MBR1611932.1 3-dehydroquinate synthase [Succinivibrio sp.]
METITVGLEDRSYPIYIGTSLDCGSLIRDALPKVKDLMVVTNETVGPLYFDALKVQLEKASFNVKVCVLKDGESYKTVDSWWQILTALMECQFGRDGAIVALGGGVVGDMAGFAASAYQRGIPFVQIPTTLLAMVDSSVGGKTAINHPLGKNMIGAFYQPKAVIADLNVLKTLPEREVSAGLGEVVKTGIIYDKDFFDFMSRDIEKVFDFDLATLSAIVKRCCEIKAMVVATDEKEHGLRAILNYGHTFGHAIEAFLGFGTWLHGEAVGLGMVIASALGTRRGYISEEDNLRMKELCLKAKLPVEIPEKMTGEDFITYMRHDKKVRSGVIRYVLPVAIGEVKILSDVSDDEVISLIESLKA